MSYCDGGLWPICGCASAAMALLFASGCLAAGQPRPAEVAAPGQFSVDAYDERFGFGLNVGLTRLLN